MLTVWKLGGYVGGIGTRSKNMMIMMWKNPKKTKMEHDKSVTINLRKSCFVPAPMCKKHACLFSPTRLNCLVDGFQFFTQRIVFDLKVAHLQVILDEFLGQRMIWVPVETYGFDWSFSWEWC